MASNAAVYALLAAGAAAPQVAIAVGRARLAAGVSSRLGDLGVFQGTDLDPGRADPVGLSDVLCARLGLTKAQCNDVAAALGGDAAALDRLGEQALAKLCKEASAEGGDAAEKKAIKAACALFGASFLGGLADLLTGNFGAPTFKAPYSPYSGDRGFGTYFQRSNLLIGGDGSSRSDAAKACEQAAARLWPKARAICWFPVPSGLAREIRADSPALVWPAASWVWESRGYKSPRLVQEEPTYYPAGVTRYIVGTTPRIGQGTGQLCWSVSLGKFVDTPGNSKELSLLLKPGHHLIEK